MLKRAHLWAFLFACLPALLVAQSSQPAGPHDRLTLDQYLELESVSDPQLSPDGTQIIYSRGWVDKLNDRRESALWIMNTDGSHNRFLVKGSSARWSPTGDRIVYTAQGEPKGTQIFVRWMDAEGAISPVTHVDQSPSSVSWSPDGTQLAFTMLVEERNSWPIRMPKAPAGAKWTEPPRIIERLDYRQDRQGFVDNGYRHLFIVPATGGTPRQLTTGSYNHASAEWTSVACESRTPTTSGASRKSTPSTSPPARSANSRIARARTATP
jgi:dipeptidyl aminopeptidase/acylaminoacyl peptidase